ncbi:hypothetical protein CEXT_617321, partial [Caerostris extrusa]
MFQRFQTRFCCRRCQNLLPNPKEGPALEKNIIFWDPSGSSTNTRGLFARVRPNLLRAPFSTEGSSSLFKVRGDVSPQHYTKLIAHEEVRDLTLRQWGSWKNSKLSELKAFQGAFPHLLR